MVTGEIEIILGRTKPRWKGNIEVDLEEIGYGLDSSGS
jgi:hypothetical protein